MMSCCHPKIILSPDVYGKIYAIVKVFVSLFPAITVFSQSSINQVAQWTQQVWYYYNEKIIRLTCNVGTDIPS